MTTHSLAARKLAYQWTSFASWLGERCAYDLVAALDVHPATAEGLKLACIDAGVTQRLDGVEPGDVPTAWAAHVWVSYLDGGLPAARTAIVAVGDDDPVGTVAAVMARFGTSSDYEAMFGLAAA